MSFESDREYGLDKQGGTVYGKYTSMRVPARNCGPDGWHIGQYVFAPLGKVISVNIVGHFASVVIEHPYEPLPRQDFPEWRAMRHFDRVAREAHGSMHRNIPG